MDSLGADNGQGNSNNPFEIHLIFQLGHGGNILIGYVLQPLLALFDLIFHPRFFLSLLPLTQNLLISTFLPSPRLISKHLSRFLPQDLPIPISIQVLTPKQTVIARPLRLVNESLAMQDSAKEVAGGRAKVQGIVDKQNRVKDGRLEKKKTLGTSKVFKSQVPHQKKPVNGYMMFRSGFPSNNTLILTVR